jgi:hypothetical protein
VSIHFTVYPVGCLIRYQVRGVPTTAEAAAFLDAVLAHRRFRSGFAFLGEAGDDNPQVPYTALLAAEVRARADRLAPCRWAVVVSSTAGTDLVRSWAEEIPTAGVEVVPFPTTAEAIDWLAGTVDHPTLVPPV